MKAVVQKEKFLKYYFCSRKDIEWTSLSKETFTANEPGKFFTSLFDDVLEGVGKISGLVDTFLIFSLDISETIFLNKASYIFFLTRIFRHQSE